MRLTDFTWLASGVMLNSFAQVGLKLATRSTGAIAGTPQGLWLAGQQLTTSLAFWLALGCYGLSVLVWVVGLSRLPVSQAYPVLSLGYIVAALLAWSALGETVTAIRGAGIGLIVAGVVLVSRST
ncbi:MAG TPA: EamA family transporter [Steroidobacteraceae bacterium]|nr:EamA family transporter [Steroidobacteraceae bacterium]